MRVLLSQEISANSVNVSYNGGGGFTIQDLDKNKTISKQEIEQALSTSLSEQNLQDNPNLAQQIFDKLLQQPDGHIVLDYEGVAISISRADVRHIGNDGATIKTPSGIGGNLVPVTGNTGAEGRGVSLEAYQEWVNLSANLDNSGFPKYEGVVIKASLSLGFIPNATTSQEINNMANNDSRKVAILYADTKPRITEMLNTIGSDSKLPVRSTKNILDIYAKYNGTPLSANINAAIETLKSGGTDPNNLWADAQYALSMYERARDMLPEFQRQADETAQLLNNAVGSAQCDGLTIGDGEIPYRRPEGFSSSALLPQMLKIYSERFDLLSQNELTHNMGVFQIALGVKGEQQTDGTTKYTVEVIDTTKQNGEEFLPPGKAGDGEPEPTSTGSQRLPGNSPSRRAVNMGTPYIDGHGNMCLVMHTNITTPEEYMIYKTPEGVWGVVVLDYSSHTHAVSSGVHNIVETRYIKDDEKKLPKPYYDKYKSVQDLLKVIGSDRWAAGVVRLSNSDLFTLISNSGSSYFRTINGRGGTQMSADDQKKYKFLLELYEIETGESIQGYEKIQDIEKTRNGRNSRIFS